MQTEIEYYDCTREGDDSAATYGMVCPHCGVYYRMKLTVKDVTRWQDGVLIQTAFDYLNVDEREMIKTGLHPACWRDMLGYREDEEDWV